MKLTMRRDRRPALLAALLLSVVVQGDMMTYNKNDKQLFFRCPINYPPTYPNDKVHVMFIQLARISSPAIALANWTSAQGPYYDEDQVTPIDAEPPSLLAARMDHVTCRDSATYRCFTSVDSKKKGVYNMVDDIEFKYEGEITTPVLRTTPRASRFKDKDTVTFECKALIGREQNTFVWETKLPGESFTRVNETRSSYIKIKQETKTTPTCDIEAVTTLELELNANDDTRVYRCRLQESNHTDFYTLSVECLDGNNCLASGVSYKYDHLYNMIKSVEFAGTVPVMENDDPVQVSVNLDIQRIVNMDASALEMVADAVLRLRWSDFRLAWNQYMVSSVNSLVWPGDAIHAMWTPDVVVVNGPGSTFDTSPETSALRFDHVGNVTWYRRLRLRVPCDVTALDETCGEGEVTCVASLSSWSHDSQDVQLVAAHSYRERDGLELVDEEGENGGATSRYRVVSSSVTKSSRVSSCCQFPFDVIRYRITVARR